MRDYLRTLASGLLLALMVRPPQRWRMRPAAHFWWLLPPAILVTIWRDRLVTQDPALFFADGLQNDALNVLLILASATAVAAWSGRRVLTWSLAVQASSASLWISLAAVAAIWLRVRWPVSQALPDSSLFLLLVGWWLLALRRTLDALLPDWHWWRRGVAAIAATLLTVAPAYLIDPARYWYPDYAVENAAYADGDGPAEEEPPSRRIAGSAEALMDRQPALVDAAVDQLEHGVAGQVDAYFLAFGGDGGEDVFKNEVEYSSKLFAQRFGLARRTLSLLNNPQTTARYPIASLSNLKRALSGIATRMDVDEDLLILFLTTHGSRDHLLYVALDPLPLDMITPESLRAALDRSGIHWRVVIVSACYAGGFVESLANPTSLVLTAASAERSSFGCGSDADLTYFGEAFLVDALNQTTSLTRAFELARDSIAVREKKEDFEASDPQISAGALIGPRLQRWERSLHAGPAVAFEPELVRAPCAVDDQDGCPPPPEPSP